MPDCYSRIEIRAIPGVYLRKAIQVLGWAYVDFPGEEGETSIYSCSECVAKAKKGIEVEATDDNHNCIFIRKTKTGKPSEYGKELSCFICGKFKKENL